MKVHPVASHFLSTNDQATLARRPQRLALLAYLLARLGDWGATLAVIVLAYQLTERVSAIALIVLVQIGARAVALRIPIEALRGAHVALQIVRLLAAAALAAVALADTFWPIVPLLTLLAFSSAAVEQSILKSGAIVGDRRQIPAINRLLGRAEQIGAIVAAILATVLLYALHESALLLVAVGSYAIAALLGRRLQLEGGDSAGDRSGAPLGTVWEQFTAVGRALQTVIIGLFTVAVVGTALRVTLIDVLVADLSHSSTVYAMLFGAIMFGAFLGPVQVPKLMGHFPIQFIVTGATISLAIGAALIVNSPSLVIIVPILLVSGIILHTVDLCSAVTLRLLSRGQSHTMIDAIAGHAVTAGQVVALLVILLMTVRFQSYAIMTAIGAGCTILIGGCFIATGGIPLTVSEIRRVLRRPVNH